MSQLGHGTFFLANLDWFDHLYPWMYYICTQMHLVLNPVFPTLAVKLRKQARLILVFVKKINLVRGMKNCNFKPDLLFRAYCNTEQIELHL